MTLADTERPVPTFRAYGVDVIREALAKMLAQADGVRDGSDIEAVHDMRVASRRLRAALTVFGPAFAGKGFERFEKDVKAVTRELGEARDLDVMIDTLEKMESDLPPSEQAGIDHFVHIKQEERAALQKHVVTALDTVEQRDLPDRLDRIVEKSPPPEQDTGAAQPGRNGTGSDEGGVDPDAPITTNASRLVAARVAELFSWEPFIHDAARVAELHAMRIAAKRLRYTMELFAPFYSPEFKSAIGQVKRVQELLGDVHDADVLVPELANYLRRLLAQEVRPHNHQPVMGVHAVDLDAAQGLLNLCRARRKDRDRTYAEFLAVWSGLRGSGFFDRLWIIMNGGPSAEPVADTRPKRGTKRAAELAQDKTGDVT
jgi:CHAD domain-containing protein